LILAAEIVPKDQFVGASTYQCRSPHGGERVAGRLAALPKPQATISLRSPHVVLGVSQREISGRYLSTPVGGKVDAMS
jgi:hypothetical protein